ncbi:adenosine deaminase [Streptomyces sp. SID13031]|uniref:adenosine deaminase n=1 Tax=Streptomyces sp. SID13031 TaxID=2706046 RepID=UPI0013CB09EE|nr:adenosine deaminase [Streptomyces sp. SID13031]NEA35803.1 adenosine deaminase [Streptomyces sp. SID13031]
MTNLPLIDLHRHLEGSIRTSTVLDIAARTGHELATRPAPRTALVADGSQTGLLPYLAKVDVAIGVLTELDDWSRAAAEAVDDAFDDGLDYLELRYCPGIIAHDTGLAPEAVIDAVSDAVAERSARRKLPVGLIGIVVRHLGADSAEQQIATLLSRKDTFCAVDLAGDEANFPAQLFAAAFAKARDAGLHVTIHAGEAAGADSVWDAVKHLGAERIGHGVRAAEDPRLMEALAERGVTLEVSLTSNTQTGAAPSYAEHQIHKLLAAGVPVTLNTDNPRVSDVKLSQEHRAALNEVGLTAEQLAKVAQQSLTAAFGNANPQNS